MQLSATESTVATSIADTLVNLFDLVELADKAADLSGPCVGDEGAGAQNLGPCVGDDLDVSGPCVGDDLGSKSPVT